MTDKEQIALLKMKNAELAKENTRFKKELKVAKDQAAELKEDVEVLTKAVRSGEEKLRLEMFLKFGSSSEKYRKLFNIPAELLEKNEDELTDEEKELLKAAKDVLKNHTDKKTSQRRDRHPKHRNPGKGGGRQTFDPSYPRQKKEFSLGCCPICGRPYTDLGSPDIHEYIDIIKEKLTVVQQIRQKGFCPGCEEAAAEAGEEPKAREIITAAAPKRFVPGGLAGDFLIATSLVDKFFYGLSVTRISKRFRLLGVNLSEQNFSHWHLRAGLELEPIAQAIRDEILRHPAVNADETRLQVLDEAHRADELKSWLWVICSATPNHSAVYFQYDPSRSSDVFKDMVGDYSGFLQADCYSGYQTDKQKYTFTLALCLAHLRRRFVDAQKAGGYQPDSLGYTTLDKLLKLIGKIYKADTENRSRWLVDKVISEQQFLQIRKETTLPLFKTLSSWINSRYELHIHDQFIIDGMDYYLNHEDLFKTYLDCANLNPDNSRVERIIRAFSTVRMNSLFAGSPDGAKTLATMESIIQTANLWDLNMYTYVEYLLKQVTLIRDLPARQVDYSLYLPWNLSPELREEFAVNTISVMKK
jgi:transposase